jgi:hypothetical protein
MKNLQLTERTSAHSKPPKERMWLIGVAVVAGGCECQARQRWRGKTTEASQHVLVPNCRSPFVHTHRTPHQQAMPTSNPAFTLAVLLNRRCKPLMSVHLNAHGFRQPESRYAASRHNRMRYMFHWHNLRTERGDARREDHDDGFTMVAHDRTSSPNERATCNTDY